MSTAVAAPAGVLDPPSSAAPAAITPRRVVAVVLGAYLVSRVLLVVCAAVLSAQHHLSLVSILSPWDGGYYVAIATSGYPSAVHIIPAPAFNSTPSAFFAFFPLFPMLGRALGIVTRMPIDWALVVVTWLAGAAGAACGAMLVAGRYGTGRGLQAGVLLAVFPGSVVDGIVYADGVALAFAVAALLAAQRRRFLLAGLLGLAASASLSLFLVPLVAALLAAAVAARRWSALVAPLLAACGAGAYLLYLWVDTGSPFTWTRVERAGWMVHLSTPWSPGTAFYDYAFWHGGVTLLTVASIVVAALGLVLLVVYRAPLAWTVLSVLVVLGVTFDGGAWLAPRFIFDAFPLVLACGIALPRRALWPVAAVAAVALVLLLAAYSPANNVFLNV